jgi:hypothetical protein
MASNSTFTLGYVRLNSAAYFFIVPSCTRSVRWVRTVMVPLTFDGSSAALASAPFALPPVPVHAESSRAPVVTARTVRRFMCISSVLGTDEHERVGWFRTLTTFS